jgi:ParB family chromosome partitioning protein
LLSADNKPADKAVRSANKPPAQRQPQQEAVSPSSAGAASDATEEDNAAQPRKLPYDDAFYVVHHLHVKMATDDFVQGGRVWMAVLREQHPEEYKALLRELGQQEQPA